MIGFLFRRIVHAVVALWLISAIGFALQEAAPGDYFDEMKLDPRISGETVAAWKARYGVGAALPQRYAMWLSGIARGDWGVSFAYGMPVRALVWPRALNTLRLTLIATAVSWALALTLGAVAAFFDSGPVRTIAATGSAIAMSVPEAITALAVVLIAIRMGLWQRSPNGAPALALPVIALTIANVPALFRYARASLVEAGSAAFIKAARANGVHGATLLGYVARAGANPLISVAGLSIGGLLSASLVAETVTGWPGIGSLMFEAVFSRDLFVVMASVLLSAVLYIVGSLIADIALYVSDPRLRRPAP